MKIYYLFYLRHQKLNSKGLTPIYLRITVSGKRLELSTGKYIEATKWSSDSCKVKGYSAEALTINKALIDFQTHMDNKIKSILNSNESFNLSNLKEALTLKKDPSKTIVPIFQEHNNRLFSLIGKSYALKTHAKYEVTLRHLIQFMKLEYGVFDIELSKINLKFITDFEYFLRTVRKCDTNAALKYIRNFKKIITQCLAYGWIVQNPFLNFKSRSKQIDKEFLDSEELLRIINTRIDSERLSIIRDIFLFSCYTGLAYVDTKNLTQDNIVTGIDSNKWISTSRQKNEIKVRVPLLSIPLEIIQKYKDHPTCINKNSLLPIYSNQKMNQHLKTIAQLCFIDKRLTYHMARHTFATTVTLTNNVPIETVSKMLGHTNLKTTQHYAKILDSKISNDMNALRARIEPNTLNIEVQSNLKKNNF